MNRVEENPTVFKLWQRCRDLLVTQPAPPIWFDLRPNRRVRRNVRRPGATSRQTVKAHLFRMPQQTEA